MFRASFESLTEFVVKCFQKTGVPLAEARIATDVLLEADLRGIESHGIARLTGWYIDRLRNGNTKPVSKIRVVHEATSTALMDGDGGLGLLVGYRAMELAIRKAVSSGAGFVSVTNSRHFGIAGYYSAMALAHDMIGISMTNSGPLVLPTFGTVPMVGTNPISVAAPTGTGTPFLLDMATSVVSAGKFESAARQGKTIPVGWALDELGEATTDPVVARAARQFLPLGSDADTSNYKGYGLGVVVDILCGVLSGIGASPMLSDSYGHFFGALRIDSFRPANEFKAMMDVMCRGLRETPVRADHEQVLVPGDREFQSREDRLKDGIPLYPTVLEALKVLGVELEVPLDL